MFKFRDYQTNIIRQGIKILESKNMLLLAMEVRTGKTLTALGIADTLPEVKNVLFITKKKVIDSNTITDDYDLLKPIFKLDLINYESVHKIDANKYDLVIVDESHSLGAFPKPSKRTKEIKQIVGDKYLILLSGTPTPESWSQIYHQFYISDYSPFKETNFYKWANEYVNVKKKRIAYGKLANDYSEANIDKIKEVIDPYVLTYTQKEAGFKSEIVETIHRVEMEPITYKLIKQLERDLVFEGKNGGVILGDTPVKLMQKVHQLYSGTIKLEDGKAVIIDDSKGHYIKEEIRGKKAIFYKFKEELNLLKEDFKDDLTTDIHEFNESKKHIALQIVSGREGISLKKADALVFYNIDFSATSYWQARDRMTTKDRAVNNVHWIFANNGLEDKIYKLVQKKKSFTTKHYTR